MANDRTAENQPDTTIKKIDAYKVLEPFTAVEATHPPAQVEERDAA